DKRARRTLPGDHLDPLPVESLADSGEVVGANAGRRSEWRAGPRSDGDLAQHPRPTSDGDNVQRAIVVSQLWHLCGQQVAHINRRLRASPIWVPFMGIKGVRVKRRQYLRL